MKITAGLPVKYSFSLPNYSAADGWVLSGQLTDAAGSYALASGLFTATTTDWVLSIPSATTTDYDAGDCMLYVVASLDGAEEVVLTQPSVIEAIGTVSHNRKMVTALNALMLGRTDKAYESLSTADGESITRLEPEKLQNWLIFYEGRLAAELSAATGAGRIKRIQVGF